MEATKAVSIPQGTEWIQRVKDKSRQNMERYHGCAQCILTAFMAELGIEDSRVVAAAGATHGGMLSSLTCGVHVAGMMILGLLMGREKIEQGIDGIFPIVVPAQQLMARLNKRLGSHSCRELTGVDFTDLEAASKFYYSDDHRKCFDFVEDGAEEIALFLKELDERGELFRPGKS